VAFLCDTDLLEKMIVRCDEAGSRTRAVCVVIVSTVLVVLAAFLVSRSGNWKDGRAKMLEQIYEQGILDVAADKANSPAVTKKGKRAKGALMKDSKAVAERSLPHLINFDNLEPKYQDILRDRHIFLRSQLENWISETEKLRVNASQVQMPVIGTRFDFNDFGIIGSFGLIGLAGFFYRCSRREQSTIATTFHLARQQNLLAGTYYQLEMSQVLHVPLKLPLPNSEEEKMQRNPFLIPIPALIMLMPLGIVALVMGFDIRSRGLGDILGGEPYTKLVVLSESFSVIVLAVIACQTLLVQQKLWATWRKAHEDALKELSGSNRNSVTVETAPG